MIPGLGRFSGEGNGNPLQYSRLENPMDRGDRQATVHGIARVGHDLATKLPPPALITLPIRVNEANFLFANLSLFTRFSVEWP